MTTLKARMEETGAKARKEMEMIRSRAKRAAEVA
jgi:hypothetical protein